MKSAINVTLVLTGLASQNVALGIGTGSQILARRHGFYLAGITLNSLSSAATQARAGWHTPVGPGIRWGLQISTLVNAVSPPKNGSGRVTYYHLGPNLTYDAYSWGPFAASVHGGVGFGRVGYRLKEDNSFYSSAVRTAFISANANYNLSDQLRLSLGWHLQKSSGIKLPGLSNANFSGGAGYVAVTTFR